MSRYTELDDIPERIFAIGDIHGCKKELRYLLDFLEDKEDLSSDDLVVFIGDYIDRGPDSKGVIDLLLDFQLAHPNSIFLKGNHEDMFLDFLGYEGRQGHVYLPNGGEETLESYGTHGKAGMSEIAQSIPAKHLSFFLNLERMLIVGDYVFVHAGLDPLRTIKTQLDDDVFWIRGEFINNIHNFDKTIVFGHTVYKDVLFDLPYKIGIDTGLVYENLLSCVEVNKKMVYQIREGKRKVKSYPFKKKQGKRKAGNFSRRFC